MHFDIHIIINYLIFLVIMLLFLQISAQPIPPPLAVPSTSHNHNDRRTHSLLPTSVQTGRSSSRPFVLEYTLHPKSVYDAQKFWVNGVDFKIIFKNANTRRYQELVNEFNYVMEDVVNEVLVDADSNGRVLIAILSSNFDCALNAMYRTRMESTGVALAELFGKMLQSNQSIDTDNDLTLHVQRVNPLMLTTSFSYMNIISLHLSTIYTYIKHIMYIKNYFKSTVGSRFEMLHMSNIG